MKKGLKIGLFFTPYILNDLKKSPKENVMVAVELMKANSQA